LRMCAYEDAHEQITRAVQLAGGDIHPSKMARLLFALAQSLHGLGKVLEAAECHAKAFALFVKSGEIDNAVQIFEQPLILMEKPANLTRLLEEAISLAGWSSFRGEALGGKYGLAVYHDTGDYARAASIFEKAVKSARASGDLQQEMTALANWGRVEADQLQFEKALSIERDALRVATENGELWIEAIAQMTSALASLGLGRVGEGENQARLLSALAGRLQTPLWNAISSVLSSAIHRQKGELRSALDVTDRALALGEPSFLVWNQAIKTLLQYEIGEADAAKELLQKVIAGASRAVVPFHWEGLLAVLIPFVAWATGDAVPLEIAEKAAHEVPLFGGQRRGDAVTVSVGLSLIAAIRKDRESAKKHYGELLPYRGLVAYPYLGLAADHVLGILSWTLGEVADTCAHFDSAVDSCRANGLLIELAYTCRDYAEFLLQGAGKAEQQKILHLCREAIPVAEASGLVHLTRRLEQVRDAAGHGKSGRPAFPDSLSDREVDVLRLISQGLSNAQIGERLFISLHTVANHVQSILEKTGAANRTEAAAYAIHHHLTND
ncbi:MAG TPA: LuxR C-terminal-related transcriptional regulator, partial [Spirochaetia bacterium]|nr:LuxR C-terminal-related transcriptional regulator [Spirochaetia bacterium]